MQNSRLSWTLLQWGPCIRKPFEGAYKRQLAKLLHGMKNSESSW